MVKISQFHIRSFVWILLQIPFTFLCAFSQTIVWDKFVPYVVRYDRTSPVLFEALISGTFSSVAFEYNTVDLPMKDDGIGGDMIAGDGIYTITFQASQIIGKLMGITVFPVTGLFDGAETAYQHEMGHQWINFLSGTLFQSGIPHWPLSDVASGVMGFNIPGSRVGGNFPYKLTPEGENYRLSFTSFVPSFNDLELYLMGLLPADSVKTHFVFNNQNQTPMSNGLLYGPITTISINNLVSLIGERIPNFNSSLKKFRIATIIISDSLLSDTEMSFYFFFAKRAEFKTTVPFCSGFLNGIAKPFYVSTGGRGELDPSLGLRTVGISDINSPTSFKLNQNYPNPFCLSTSIHFKIPKNSFVTLTVYNLQGRELEKSVCEKLSAGEYHVEWNPTGLSNGVYFYHLQAGEFGNTKKLVLFR
jgi:hypothetical protein